MAEISSKEKQPHTSDHVEESQETADESTTKSTMNTKKRSMKPRSVVWEHFTIFFEGNQRKARCNYCATSYLSQSKKHGTSTLKNHLTVCKKLPCSQDLKQSQLSLQTIHEGDVNVEGMGSPVGSLMNWRFDLELCRTKLAAMVIKDELPFRIVDGEGFKDFVATLQPKFKIPSRWTVSRDCYQLFLDEKLKLREYFKKTGQSVCLTTDTWTSLQNLNYMCITAHFIDGDWKYHKKIINFCTIESHRGEDLGRQINGCLREWEIARVFSITVDNASSNDTCIQYLKRRLSSRGAALVKGKFLHMRCIAHVIALIVNDGLKEVNPSITKVRDAVRFIRHSPARLAQFKECCVAENIECKSMLCLDVCARWNSTYLMLSVAYKFTKAFDRFELEDRYFHLDLPNGSPTTLDWENVRRMIDLLSTFYHLTIRISGSLYVTSNKFYNEVSRVKLLLKKWMVNDEEDVRAMGIKMMSKAEKYWGDPKKMNKLIYVAVVVDPNYKFEFIEYALVEEYGEEIGKEMAKGVKDAMIELFDAYKVQYQSQDSTSNVHVENVESSSSKVDSFVEVESMGEKFKKQKMQKDGSVSKSELDIYLEDKNDVTIEKAGTNILDWWKLNECRYPILSRLARDVLSMPISTVALESAFSAGSRVLDPFRSSLTPKIVECLICTQDWIRRSKQPISIEEDLESLQKLEEAINNVGASDVNENTLDTMEME